MSWKAGKLGLLFASEADEDDVALGAILCDLYCSELANVIEILPISVPITHAEALDCGVPWQASTPAPCSSRTSTTDEVYPGVELGTVTIYPFTISWKDDLKKPQSLILELPTTVKRHCGVTSLQRQRFQRRTGNRLSTKQYRSWLTQKTAKKFSHCRPRSQCYRHMSFESTKCRVPKALVFFRTL